MELREHNMAEKKLDEMTIYERLARLEALVAKKKAAPNNKKAAPKK